MHRGYINKENKCNFTPDKTRNLIKFLRSSGRQLYFKKIIKNKKKFEQANDRRCSNIILLAHYTLNKINLPQGSPFLLTHLHPLIKIEEFQQCLGKSK